MAEKIVPPKKLSEALRRLSEHSGDFAADPGSERSKKKEGLRAVLAAINPHQGADAATLEAAMRNTADRARFGKELVEACKRLKEKIDANVVALMNMMNKALDFGTDGRAYTYDAARDAIIANATNPDLISSFQATAQVTRELEEVVRDLPSEIEKLFHVLDESHAEFVTIITGEQRIADKRVFAPLASINQTPQGPAPARGATSIEASLRAALGESANRATFLEELVKASKRHKEQIDARVVTLLTMINEALSRGVDDIAYSYDAANNRMTAVPQPDLIVGFTTTENVARELADAVANMPREIQALIEELLRADEEFDTLIEQGLTKKSKK